MSSDGKLRHVGKIETDNAVIVIIIPLMDSEINCYTCKSSRFHTYKKDDIVTFEILNAQKGSAINVRLISDENDLNVLIRAFSSGEKEYSESVETRLNEMLDNYSIDGFIKILLDNIELIVNHSKLLELKRAMDILEPEAKSLRAKLNYQTSLLLYGKAENLKSFEDEILERNLHKVNGWTSFCKSNKAKMKYGGKLYKVMPKTVKNEIIERHFKTFFSQLDKFRNQEPEYITSYTPEEIRSDENTQDIRLAKSWIYPGVDESNKGASEAKMRSARWAEKVAKKFYESLHFNVEDIAITQLNEDLKQEEWKKCDLRLRLLDVEISIDVKNARRQANGPRTRYSEYCVPEFKKGCNNTDVKIAGVFSPYIKKKEMDSGNLATKDDIVFLGETDISRINELEKAFESDEMKIEIRGKSEEKGNVIPPWVFEYPEKFYEEQRKVRNKLKEFCNSQDMEYPDLKELEELDKNPIPAFLVCGIPLPSQWKNALSEEQQKFVDKLLHKKKEFNRISLPILFLSLLTHFIEMVSSDCKDYDPNLYRQLIFTDNKKMPAGFYDPLEIISSFIETTSVLWKKDSIRFHEFESFRFLGLGLLTGKRKGEDKTILAYCGGKDPKRNNAKCGKYPLIKGREKTCSCGKLICPECRFCSVNCEEYKNRIESSRTRRVQG